MLVETTTASQLAGNNNNHGGNHACARTMDGVRYQPTTTHNSRPLRPSPIPLTRGRAGINTCLHGSRGTSARRSSRAFQSPPSPSVLPSVRPSARPSARPRARPPVRRAKRNETTRHDTKPNETKRNETQQPDKPLTSRAGSSWVASAGWWLVTAELSADTFRFEISMAIIKSN